MGVVYHNRVRRVCIAAINYQDKIDCPGPAKIASIERGGMPHFAQVHVFERPTDWSR